jgi:hypothetical protein
MRPAMQISFRCLSEFEAFLPRPVLAKQGLPDWVKAMPRQAQSALLDGEVRSVKHCPPFLDAMRHGILMPLATDLRVREGRFEWDWDLPVATASRMTRAPIGLHLPEQLVGSPVARPDRFAVKFTNFWSITLPAGWSMLFTHPLNREELPFRTLTGRVDCDRYAGGFVHFPALWIDPDFAGVLPRGTPVAQAFPVPRQELSLDIASFEADELAWHIEMQDALGDEPGTYRKRSRAR